MRAERPLLLGSLAILLLGVLMALAGATTPLLGLPPWPWFHAHSALLTAGFVLPALLYLHIRFTLPRCPGAVDAGRLRQAAFLYLSGAAASASGLLLQVRLVAAAGAAAVVLGGILQSGAMLKTLPRQSVVDVERDPLSKGDDACLKQIRFAHYFLPIGLFMLALPLSPYLADSAAAPRLALAGLHVLLVGYALLSVYGVSHLAVPRYSGVPAIAAGAIKGELHSTLAGIVLLAAGFLLGHGSGVGRGLLVAAGAFIFLGIFVFMGVLGANIMKNKSRTQRVSPAFAYIPWTFAGVLWLVCGVLMGWFLTAIPHDLLDAAALRFTHAHFALLGGVAQIWLGFVPRELAARARAPVPGFAGTARGAFLALNAGLLLLVAGRFADPSGDLFLLGGLLVALAVLLHLGHIRKLIPAAEVPPA